MNYENLKKLIKKSGLTIKEFADILGYHPSTISNMKQHPAVPNHFAVIAALIAEMEYQELDYKKVIEKLDLKTHGNKK